MGRRGEIEKEGGSKERDRENNERREEREAVEAMEYST